MSWYSIMKTWVSLKNWLDLYYRKMCVILLLITTCTILLFLILIFVVVIFFQKPICWNREDRLFVSDLRLWRQHTVKWQILRELKVLTRGLNSHTLMSRLDNNITRRVLILWKKMERQKFLSINKSQKKHNM